MVRCEIKVTSRIAQESHTKISVAARLMAHMIFLIIKGVYPFKARLIAFFTKDP